LIHWLFAISGERVIRSIFFQKNRAHITQNIHIILKYIISAVLINNIFQNRKLKTSSCKLPNNPTKNIPHASHIWAIISLLDSREV